MTATSTRPTSSPPWTVTASRLWHLLIAAVVGAALVIQVGLIVTGGPDPNSGEAVGSLGIGTRVIQTLSYFTIQSNILVLIVAVSLVIDPVRDGRVWRVLRLDALLGITITGLVYDLVLVDYVHPSGWQLVATIGFHYISPWATLLGWLLFGPRPRIDRSTVAWAFVWPLAWIAYTFVRGALVGWYPYPFLDVDRIGYARSIVSTAVVFAVALVLVAIFAGIDRFRTVGATPAPSPRSVRAVDDREEAPQA
ncbi:hypothetical protein EV188_104633 [Actinomycetospora succinea]|uniref:FAR-17a/AIG1-like protein n=1 Tax=Actinomycetospora succinea TaxID=663603 RepID=A0A4R6VDR5_9PSEU|nr:Pr6Pr family membrane protein [Actinomycetospora succinea]TDQ58884.1 hypothetical protein EV188_104633 [Actinomycetospora succinea]